MECLTDFLDPANLSAQLSPIDLSEAAIDAKTQLLLHSAEALQQAGVTGKRKVTAYFVPGRIEVLGKHTDYCGGRSIIVAVEQGFCLIAAERPDEHVRVIVAQTGQQKEFTLEPDLTPAVGDWSNYPMTVARRLVRNFGPGLTGADIAFASDLPQASGMSSSSAMMIAIYLALAKINRLDERDLYRENINTPESLAGYLATIENGQNFGTLLGDKGVGTFGGSEDHTAILCCSPGKLSQYSYCPVRFERFLTLPKDYVLAIGSSGVIAAKTGTAMAKYNRASQLATAATQAWRTATGRDDPHLAAAAHSSADALDRIRAVLRQGKDGEFTVAELIGRFEHFFTESEQIIPEAGDALARNDIATFGRMVDLSQTLTESLLKNQVPETVFLAKTARESGAAAASAFGAGFGGSVWALVHQDAAADLLEKWQAKYNEAFPQPAQRATFFLTHPAPAAAEID